MKNLGFEAPGFLETGQARDFTTELAVYQNGQEIAHKTIRVNDPLEVEGYSLHENNFGPAPDIFVGDADGKPLWDGPVPFDGQAGGMPYGSMIVPGRDILLEFLLRARRRRDRDGHRPAQPDHGRGRRRPADRPSRSLPLAPRAGESFAVAGHRHQRRRPGLRRLHAADREEGPGQADRLGRVRVPDHRHRDHVLPAAAAGLGPGRRRRPASRSSPGPTATSTSSASSGGCWTTWSRARPAIAATPPPASRPRPEAGAGADGQPARPRPDDPPAGPPGRVDAARPGPRRARGRRGSAS